MNLYIIIKHINYTCVVLWCLCVHIQVCIHICVMHGLHMNVYASITARRHKISPKIKNLRMDGHSQNQCFLIIKLGVKGVSCDVTVDL